MLISTDSSAMDEDGADKQNGIRLPATNGPRPYKCEVCQRSFREVATLRKHEQLHRADRPYVCQTCGKSFLWSSNLKVHERVHTGERPYKCKICHRCFTQSNDLRRHERNVHMRGKLVNYRSPATPASGRNTSQMNLATYQAFAMQQRALLHHALTYESLMQSAVVTQSRLMQGGVSTVSLPSMSTTSDVSVSTSSDIRRRRPTGSPDSIKLEQVTPPTSPNSSHERSLSNPGLLNSTGGGDQLYMAPRSSSTSAINTGLLHSPPSLPTSSYSGYVTGSNSVNGSPPTLTHVTAAMSPTLSGFNNQPNTSTDNKVIDLSMKSTSSGESEDGDWKSRIIAEHFKREELANNASKSPPISETESDEKRDVTTTSITPTGDSGIHHCPHCNIFFHDFTMYHLHKSLHSPVDNDPFRCPSCQKHCQDRIEFMFHIVWHVKYPHTIPNYEPFKEEYQT
ncbi:zinc finger and BTB domain-containing protein 24-like isoform X4 [Ostrea edulis]|uniref:zinc finger and BTB domain-containing protein 24-like isoform X4 n=1 Tax=Ostrea edulis TaxID=37623 RepID=UPI0024AF39DF|nr:zinc finger and BTB domain-containing protein 24-like isoform X4 [Ostrea edulis]